MKIPQIKDTYFSVNNPLTTSQYVNFKAKKVQEGDEFCTQKPVENFEKLVSIIPKDMHLFRIYKTKDTIRAKIGKEIQGFKGLYNEEKSVCCYIDKNGNLENIYLKDKHTNQIDIFDVQENSHRYFSDDEVAALLYYKKNPQWIHPKLRFNQNRCSGEFLKEVENTIKVLDKIFENKDKLDKNKNSVKLYRALQSNLSEDDIVKLQTIGEIFTEKSFCSTTTNINVAKRFKHYNPILEIDFPKNSNYIDIEKIYNIDGERFHENEFLLNRNSRFKVTGFDPQENIIKVKYLG